MLYFSMYRTRSSVVEFRIIFPCVECAPLLWKFVLYFLRVEHALLLWNYLLYFSSCGMRSSLVGFCVIYFCMWKALWYCRIPCDIFQRSECALVFGNFLLYFSALQCNTLWYCENFCYIFHLWNTFLSLWYCGILIYFSACGMRSGIVKFCVIYFLYVKGPWYCIIPCYIFLCSECDLVLWNLCYILMHASTTHSNIVEFCVLFFCLWNTL